MFARHREAIEKARPSVPYEPYSVGAPVCWDSFINSLPVRLYGRITRRPDLSSSHFPHYFIVEEDESGSEYAVIKSAFIDIG